MKKNPIIRWGLVGLGSQGERLAAAIKAAGQHLVGVAGHDEKHTREFAKHFGAKAYSWRELLKDRSIHAIGIATPNDQHAREALAALAAGKAILCEKPLALTLSDGKKIERAANKLRRRSAVDFHLRVHPAILFARGMLQNKEIGDIRYIEMIWSIGSWRAAKLPPLSKFKAWRENPVQAGGGALMARGVHLFDLLRFLTGKEVTDVKAYADGEIDRTTCGIVVLDKKIPVMLATSKTIPGADNRIVIYGSKARASILNVFSLDKQATLEIQDERGSKVHTFPKQSNFRNVLKEFGKPKSNILATISDGVAAIKIAEAWKVSALKK